MSNSELISTPIDVKGVEKTVEIEHKSTHECQYRIVNGGRIKRGGAGCAKLVCRACGKVRLFDYTTEQQLIDLATTLKQLNQVHSYRHSVRQMRLGNVKQRGRG